MKKLRYSGYLLSALSALVLIVLMTHISSCSSSNPTPTPSAQDAVKAKLIANNWKVSTVTVDGVDQSPTYAGLTLQFAAAGTYSSTNGKAVWPASDTWAFSSTDGTTFKRGDGIDVKVDVTDATLKLTLTWAKTTLGGGKSASIPGVNVFSFTK